VTLKKLRENYGGETPAPGAGNKEAALQKGPTHQTQPTKAAVSVKDEAKVEKAAPDSDHRTDREIGTKE